MNLVSAELLLLISLVTIVRSAVVSPPDSQNQIDNKDPHVAERPSLRLIPDIPDHIYRSGDTLKLICEADFPLDWKIPSILETRDYGIAIKNELEDRISIADEQLREVDDPPDDFPYPYRSTLTVIEASYTDTGYYACHHRENEEGDEEIKTYIYVEDEDNLIVQHRQVMMFSQRLSRFSIIVPCKPSHPDIQMSMMIDKDVKADWVFDPHVGFYVDNDFLDSIVGEHRPIYRCVARHPKGFEADTPVYIWQPFKPLVSVESEVLIQMPARRIVLNQNFQLNCSITYYQRQNLTVELHWMVPQLQGIDGRRVRSDKVILAAPPRGGKKRTTVRLSLRIFNATLDDGGFYMCASHQTSHDVNSMDWAEVFVHIHHKEDEKYLMVSTPFNDGPREVESGKTVTFVVYVDARPDPVVNWYRGNELEPINTTSKFVVHRSWGKTYLKIRDTSIADNGIYRLVAFAGNQKKSVNFTLVVEEKRSQSSIMSWRFSFDYVSPLFWIHAQPAIVGFSYLQCRPPMPCQTFSRRSGENDETVWDVADTKQQIDSKSDITLEPLTIYVNSADQNPEDTGLELTGSETDRFFYLGWVVNTYYNSTGNGTWLWTQTNGSTIPLDLSSPPPGFNVSKRQCLERRGYCYRIKGINTNSDELGHSVLAGEVFTWTYISHNNGVLVSVPIQIQDARLPVIQKSSDSEVLVSPGKSVSLFCLADGQPTPTSQWLMNGQPVSAEWVKETEDGTFLSIPAAEKSLHVGQYACRFENIAGTVEQTFNVRVLN